MKVEQLLKKSPTYNAIISTMRDYEMAYQASREFKKDVRPKRPSEDANLWEDMIDNTAVMPVARHVVDLINDTVFSEPIYRDLEFATPQGFEVEDDLLTEWSELVCYDADLNYRNINAFMEHVGELTSIFGHCWVGVDSDPNQNIGRPYCVAIPPTKVWDWSFTIVNGRYMPEFIKVCEYEDQKTLMIKCYYLGTTTDPSRWEQYIVQKNDNNMKDVTAVSSGTFPPGMAIPLFLSFTRRDTRFNDLGISDIDCASDVQREIFKLECEAYLSLQFAKTLIRAAAGIKVPATQGGIIRANKDDVEAISVDTQDVKTITEKQDKLLLGLETLTGLGGLRQNASQPASGISIIEERDQLHKIAKAKAREMETTEELLWTYLARFMGMRWAGNIKYGTNYSESDTKLKIAKLEVAKKLSPNNPVIDNIINQKLIKMLVDDDEKDFYIQQLVAITPGMVLPEEEPEYIESNDLGPQVPENRSELTQEKTNDKIPYTETVVKTGLSSYNSAADMILGKDVGKPLL